MKLGDPIMIGYPAHGEPITLGYLHKHNLPEDLVIGASVKIHDKRFTVNVSYVPHNPRKERLIPLLVPKEEFWAGNAVRVQSSTKKEEYQF